MNYKYFSETRNGQIKETYMFLPELDPKAKVIFTLLKSDYFNPEGKEGYSVLLNKKDFGIEIIFVGKTFDLSNCTSIANDVVKRFNLFAEEMINNTVNLSNAIELLKYPEFADAKKEIENDLEVFPMFKKLIAKTDPFSTEYIGYHIQKMIREDLKLITDSINLLAGKFADANMDFDSSINSINDWIDKNVKPNLAISKAYDLQIQSLFNRISQIEETVNKLSVPWYSKVWNFITFHWERM